MTTTVRQDGDALVFSGALDRAAVAGLWPQLRKVSGVRRIDLGAVALVDSAGLALLARVCASAGITDVTGEPTGLAELRNAYRLDRSLAFAS